MKLKRLGALILTVALLCACTIVPVFAEQDSRSETAEPVLNEDQTGRFNVYLDFHGGYTAKSAKLYGRRLIKPRDYPAMLGPWELIWSDTNITAWRSFNVSVPSYYAMFAYSFDILWGTDWPFSGIFWTDIDTPVTDIKLTHFGFVRNACFSIEVNGKMIFLDENCSSHSEWKP